VKYSLTDYGESLEGILHQLCVWGEENVERRQEKGEAVELLAWDKVEA